MKPAVSFVRRNRIILWLCCSEKLHSQMRRLKLQTLSQASLVVARAASFVFSLSFHGSLPGRTRIDLDVEGGIRENRELVARISSLDLSPLCNAVFGSHSEVRWQN